MNVLKSTVAPDRKNFAANKAAMQSLVEDLRGKVALIAQGGGAKARERHIGANSCRAIESRGSSIRARRFWNFRNSPHMRFTRKSFQRRD